MNEPTIQRLAVKVSKSCLRKMRFDNKRHADNAAQEMRRRTDRRDSLYTIIAYHCGNCGGWHVGHDQRKLKGRRR